LAAAIREALPGAEIELIPAGAGIFNVSAGGVEYWNKHLKGGFPNQDEFVKYLVHKLKAQQQQQQQQR
jgi:predicted Rdx family selenoprotein